MTCPKCGSSNISVQMMSDIQLKRKHHNIFWWIIIGWWFTIIKWIFFTPIALIIKIFAPKKQKIKQTNYSVCVCQNCGNNWRV